MREILCVTPDGNGKDEGIECGSYVVVMLPIWINVGTFPKDIAIILWSHRSFFEPFDYDALRVVRKKREVKPEKVWREHIDKWLWLIYCSCKLGFRSQSAIAPMLHFSNCRRTWDFTDWAEPSKCRAIRQVPVRKTQPQRWRGGDIFHKRMCSRRDDFLAIKYRSRNPRHPWLVRWSSGRGATAYPGAIPSEVM